jgi:hypothetical protein
MIRRNKFMRNIKAIVVLATLVVVAATIVLGATFRGGTLPKVYAQEEARKSCGVHTLEGTYALTFSGFTTRGPIPAAINDFTPVAGGGLVIFDGHGNISTSETVSVGGLVSPVDVPGTYTVNSDCTGTFSTPHAHLNLVIIGNGRKIQAVNTDPGNVVLDNFIKEEAEQRVAHP